MRKDIALPVLALAGGGACLALRRWQLAAALDPETELFRSVPATPVLIGVLALLALLFLVPTLFIVFQTLQEKIKPVEFTSPDWCIQAEIEVNQKEPIDEEAKTDDDTK